jgi:hypothetical protein
MQLFQQMTSESFQSTKAKHDDPVGEPENSTAKEQLLEKHNVTYSNFFFRDNARLAFQLERSEIH